MRFPIIVGVAWAAAAGQTTPGAGPAEAPAPAEAATPRAKPRGPQPAGVVTVSNATANTAVTVTVTGESKTGETLKAARAQGPRQPEIAKTPALPGLGRGEIRGRRRSPDR